MKAKQTWKRRHTEGGEEERRRGQTKRRKNKRSKLKRGESLTTDGRQRRETEFTGGERPMEGNADRHVSMGTQERFGVRESCIIAGSQWEHTVKTFKRSVLATEE